MDSHTDNSHSPPFDPTPVAAENPFGDFANHFKQYTIVARGAPVQTPDKTLDESAWRPNTDGCESEVGFWRSILGPSKNELRAALNTKTLENSLLRDENSGFRKKIGILEKQVAIWEKTYETASELACQRIKDVAILRQQLNTANEEIERLCMAPQLIAKSKAPRPKRAK